MKLALSLLGLLALTFTPLRADDAARLAALQHADDTRTAAMVTADPAALAEVLSADLHYTHASGVTDTRASFTEALTSGKLKYTAYAYEQREFTFPAPGIALMSGKARLKLGAAGTDTLMSFLSVWREEQGHWRFLAWQSSKLTPAPAK
jgi:hypothetical protein